MSANRPDEFFIDPALCESQFAYAAQFTDVPHSIQLATTRLYRADTQLLTVKFHYNGFQVSKIYGDYTQSEFSAEHSKYVVIAKKCQ